MVLRWLLPGRAPYRPPTPCGVLVFQAPDSAGGPDLGMGSVDVPSWT